MDQKEQPARRVLGNYASIVPFRLLFCDMDALRHINNGATARYFEECRAAQGMMVFGQGAMASPNIERQILLAASQLDYLAQAFYPGTIEIGTAIGRIGTSSWQIVQAAFQNGRCFALCQCSMVLANGTRSTPLNDAEREKLQAMVLADRPEQGQNS